MIAIACFLLGALPQGLDEAETHRRLKTVRITVDFRDLPIQNALGKLRDATGINLVLQAKWPNRIPRVNLRLTNASAGTVLNVILKPRDLQAVFLDGALVIADPERFRSRARLVVYDVRTLTSRLGWFPGVNMTLERSSMTFCLSPESEWPEHRWGKDLERLVVQFTGGVSWNNNPSVSVNLNNGLLFVRQTPEVHTEIRRLLRILERAG